MTSSSPSAAAPEGAVLQAGSVTTRSVEPRELRSGAWTRLGDRSVLGDAVTEHTLAGLADQARSAARAQGYARGWAEGRRAADERAAALTAQLSEQSSQAEQRREAEHRAAVATLLAAAGRLDQSVTLVCQSVEEQAGELAAKLTEELVAHELEVAQQPGLPALRRALALTVGEPLVSIRVNPQACTPELASVTGAAKVRPDPAVALGDAVIEMAAGVLDARISSALARVQEVLRS